MDKDAKAQAMIDGSYVTPRDIELNGRVIHTEFICPDGTTMCMGDIDKLYEQYQGEKCNA